MCRKALSTKEPLIIGLFCRKRPIMIRHIDMWMGVCTYTHVYCMYIYIYGTLTLIRHIDIGRLTMMRHIDVGGCLAFNKALYAFNKAVYASLIRHCVPL